MGPGGRLGVDEMEQSAKSVDEMGINRDIVMTCSSEQCTIEHTHQ